MRILMALGLLVAVSACNRAPAQDDVVVVPAPVTSEPVYTGKYN